MAECKIAAGNQSARVNGAEMGEWDMEAGRQPLHTSEELKTYLQYAENVVVYGAGDYGRRLVDFLFFAGEREKIRGIAVTQKKSDEHAYRDIPIIEAEIFFTEHKDCHVILAASLEHWDSMEKTVRRYGVSFRKMSQELYMDIRRKMDTRTRIPYRGVDFMLAGFEKCGTTSLYAALRKVKSVYLSDKKESHYFSWCNTVEHARQRLAEVYFDNIREGQIVGMIEPTFWLSVKKIREVFGTDIKILFLVRNPVDAVFSYFKMANRLGEGELSGAYQKTGGKFDVSMFDEYFAQITAESPYIFQYSHWLKKCFQDYPKEQVKVIFFEEFIKRPRVILNEILDYIGTCETFESESLPHVNEGNYVMADEEGYRLGGLKHTLFQELDFSGSEDKTDRSAREKALMEVQKKYAKAEKINGVKMAAAQRERLELHFNESVRQLEEMLGRDLSEIWF